MPNGWAQNNNTWSAPFHNHSFDSSGLCQSAGVSSNRCNGSVAMAYADSCGDKAQEVYRELMGLTSYQEGDLQ